MRNKPANWVIPALLMLQFAIGLQWQVAHAVAASPERQMNGMQAGHCPGHQSKDSRSVDDKHDCCRSLGCQCDYAQSPLVLAAPRASAAFSALLLLPVLDARPPVARTNELFRPPIA
jgi:hypothetical protein